MSAPSKTKSNVGNRAIFCRDNLDVLRGINSDCVDLIYLDPPFNKKKVFTAPIETSAKGASFKDIFTQEDLKEEWVRDIKEDHFEIHTLLEAVRNLEGRTSYNFCYLAYMAIRLIECHRVLKDTGSIYLHCDPTMSHYLKLLLDRIFGESNFRNEIVWRRSVVKGTRGETKTFGAILDSVFFYAKTAKHVVKIPKSFDPLRLKDFKHRDENGEYRAVTPLIADRALHKSPRYEWNEINPQYGWRVSKANLIKLDKENRIHWRNDKPYRKQYRDEYEGADIGVLWSDIPPALQKERTGYPTQKPVRLLERIIKASTKDIGEDGEDEPAIVLDPFCGCATTCVAAEKLERRWIGIDISVKAYELVKKRLKNEITDPENLFDYDKEIRFYTDPPTRTDGGADGAKRKHVYVISNSSYAGEYKVGVASDVDSRLRSYQTSDPNRAYKLEYSRLTEHYNALEQHIHEKFENRREWVRADLQDIIDAIESYDHEDNGKLNLG